MDARRYAGVALRATWASLLLKLHLRTLAAAAYDEALVRAAALAEEFAPTPEPMNLWSTALMTQDWRSPMTCAAPGAAVYVYKDGVRT